MTQDNRPTTTEPSIDVPDVVRRDERFVTSLTGLEAGQQVTVTVESDDEPPWQATATFEADDEGVVDLSTTAPIDGDWTTADAMAPVWALSPTDGSDGRYRDVDPLGAVDLHLTAETGGATATASVTVQQSDPGVERHETPEDGPHGAWFEPAGDGPHPAVVTLHGSNGRPLESEAALLASEGYATFALAYLGQGDLPDFPRGVPLEYVEDAVDWFLDRDAVAGEGYGIHGISMGAQLSLLLASEDDRVEAAVVDSGSPWVFSGGPAPAWTRDGEAVDCIPIREEPPDTWDDEVNGAVDRHQMWNQLLEAASTEERRQAAIPVEEGSAAVLLQAGSDDLEWPAVTFAASLVARLDALGYDRPVDLSVYHEAGHGFGAPHKPTAWRPAVPESLAAGGEPMAHGKATVEAWDELLAWFETELPS
ncbi:acyl-CoA thioester hydrolase/BAAT C-terminal domain-containing protein [Halobacteriales archaeon Cl-PHB]